MVITPGIPDLPCTLANGRKFFELTAEEVLWELVDGIIVRAWGYNGSTPRPYHSCISRRQGHDPCHQSSSPPYQCSLAWP